MRLNRRGEGRVDLGAVIDQSLARIVVQTECRGQRNAGPLAVIRIFGFRSFRGSIGNLDSLNEDCLDVGVAVGDQRGSRADLGSHSIGDVHHNDRAG